MEFSRWGTAFGDDQIAAAAIDRIVHHGRLVKFKGEPHRVLHALMQGKGAQKGCARDVRILLKSYCTFN